MKYKGKYQLRAEIDKRTGDYCRDDKGNLENYSDIWIVCNGKGRIFHYGHNILEFYIPSLGRGHNIMKAIYQDEVGSCDKFIKTVISKRNNQERQIFDYKLMYSELNDRGIVLDAIDTSEEILFKFKAVNMETLAKYIKPKPYRAKKGGSPFAVGYLPKVKKNKYDISLEDLALYKEITASIPKGNINVYLNINNGFMGELASKNNRNIVAIKDMVKASGLRQKEYFHSIGEWKSYIEYIAYYIKENLNDTIN
jgi:hypothetical protein